MAKKKDFNKKQFDNLNRKMKPDTKRAVTDAFNATYNPGQMGKDMRYMTKNINPDALDKAAPIVKKIVERVMEDQRNLDNKKEVY